MADTITLIDSVITHSTQYDSYWSDVKPHVSCAGNGNTDMTIVLGVDASGYDIASTTYMPQCVLNVIYTTSAIGELEWGYRDSGDITLEGSVVSWDYVTPGSYADGINLVYYASNGTKEMMYLTLVYAD